MMRDRKHNPTPSEPMTRTEYTLCIIGLIIWVAIIVISF